MHRYELYIHPCFCTGSLWGHTHLASPVLSAPARSAGHLFWSSILSAGHRLALMGASATAKITTAFKAEYCLPGWGASYRYELWGRKGESYNAIGLRGVSLGLLPAMWRGDRGRDFKHNSWFRHVVKHWRKTRDWLSTKDIIIQRGLNIHLLSPGISSNTFTYLKWRKEPHPTLHLLLFFDPFSFSAERDPPSCCVSQREGQMTKGEGRKGSSGKATERRRKRDQVWQLEGMGKKGESLRISEQKLGDPRRNKPGNPKHPPHSALNSLKASGKGCLVSLQHSFTKDVKQLL